MPKVPRWWRLNESDGHGLRRIPRKGEATRIKKSFNMPVKAWLSWQKMADDLDMPVSELVEKCGVWATHVHFQQRTRRRVRGEEMAATSVKVTQASWVVMRRAARERKLKLWQLVDQGIRGLGPKPGTTRAV